MTCEDILDQAIAILQRRDRVTYRTLQRQFQLDDDALNDLRLYAQAVGAVRPGGAASGCASSRGVRRWPRAPWFPPVS